MPCLQLTLIRLSYMSVFCRVYKLFSNILGSRIKLHIFIQFFLGIEIYLNKQRTWAACWCDRLGPWSWTPRDRRSGWRLRSWKSHGLPKINIFLHIYFFSNLILKLRVHSFLNVRIWIQKMFKIKRNRQK